MSAVWVANGYMPITDILVGTRSSASPAIFGRKDFDPIDKHKYSFTIFTRNRQAFFKLPTIELCPVTT